MEQVEILDGFSPFMTLQVVNILINHCSSFPSSFHHDYIEFLQEEWIKFIDTSQNKIHSAYEAAHEGL